MKSRLLYNLEITDITIEKNIQILHELEATRLLFNNRKINLDTEKSINNYIIDKHI